MSALKLCFVVAVALIIAAGALVGVYAVAETIVVSVAAGFNAETRPTRLGALGGAVKRSTAAYEVARAECRTLSDVDRRACLARVKSERARTTNEANPTYNCGTNNVEPNAGSQATKTPRPSHSPQQEARPHINERAPRNLAKTDTTLYQTHRQMPL